MNALPMSPDSRIPLPFQAARPDEIRTDSRWAMFFLRYIRGYALVGKTQKPQHALLGGVRMKTYWRLRPRNNGELGAP